MALLADVAFFGSFLAALVFAFLAGFHSLVTARLLVISSLADVREAQHGKRTNGNG